MSEQVGQIHYDVSADTSKLLAESSKAKTWLDRLTSGFGRTEKAAKGTELQMTQTAKAARQLATDASKSTSALSSLTKLVGVVITARSVQAVIAMSDQYGQMASRIRNATGSTEEYEAVQARLLQTANGTYRALSEAQEVYLSVSDTLRDLGYSTAEVLDITDSLSYAFVRDAARADQATTAMDAYSKALMKGKVEADGWASIMAATPSIVKGIAAATGETEAKIKQLGATGKLSLQALNEGLRRSLDENRKMADAMTVSVADAGTKLKNALTVFIGKVNESSGASKGLTDSVGVLSQALQDPETIKAAQDMAAGVVTAFGWMITGAKDVVKFAKWMGEEVAASFHGVASDDIDRLQKKADALRLKLGARQGFFLGIGSDDIKAELAKTEALINEFRQRQAAQKGAIEAQAARDAMAMVSDPGGGGGGGRRGGKTNAEAPTESELKKAAEARRKLAQEAAQAVVDVEEQAAQDAAEAWGYWEQSQINNQKARADALKEQWQQVFDFIDAEQERAIAEGQAFIDAQAQAARQAKEFGDDFALVMTSAASDALQNWQGVRSLVGGILKDLAQLALREAILKPAGAAISSAVGSSGGLGQSVVGLLGSILPKFDTGTDYVPRDMAAIIHKGERIVPAAENRRGPAGGGRVVNLTNAPVFQIDSRSDIAQVRTIAEQSVLQGNQQMLQLLQSQGVL